RNSWVARFLGPSGGAASAFLMGVPLLARSSTFQVLSAGESQRKSKRAGPTDRHTGVFGIISDPLLDNQPNLVQVGSCGGQKVLFVSSTIFACCMPSNRPRR